MEKLWILFLVAGVLAGNEDKIEFKQLEVDSPIKEVLYCGAKKETILILTSERQAYRSENSGFSWKPISFGSETLKIDKIIFSKADSKLTAFLSKEGKNWYSEDCGKTIKTLNYQSLMEDFRFHPKMRTWGLAVSWNKCSEVLESECTKSRTLFLTKDLGSTWTQILDFVVQFSWGHSGLDTEILKSVPLERIYVTRNNNPDSERKSGWSTDVDFMYSDNFFDSKEVLVTYGNKFLLADKFILVATAVVEDSDEVRLMVASSPDIETFYQVELPVKRIPEHSYTLLDTSEGSIFLHVNHYGSKSNYGTIYISDGTGRRFSISLMHNARGSSGYCDFDKVKGLEGIYIANIFDKNHLLTDNDEKVTKKEAKKFQKTVITFDKGGEWKSIEPPERDSASKRIICEDDCSLHLHSVTSSFSPVYSNENAIGIILATGNVGRYLSYKEDELNTYLSRDGGLTWTEVKKGEFIYDMGDHGAIILMADSQKATDTLYFSWNEGMSWEKILIDSPLEVENILIEPTSTSQKFLVYGERDGKGVTVAVDFSTYHEPMCRKPDKAGSSESDYEIWTPHDLMTSGCLMGRKVEYVRRKQDAECFNGEEFERPKFIENCECTDEDFECDLGYYREESGVCNVIEGYIFSEPECDENDFMYTVTGYRRIAGDTCQGGVSSQYEPIQIPCKDSSGMFFYMFLAIGFAAGSLWAVNKYGGQAKDLISYFSKDTFDRSGFFSDLTKAPEGMEEEEMAETKLDAHEEEFDPRN